MPMKLKLNQKNLPGKGYILKQEIGNGARAYQFRAEKNGQNYFFKQYKSPTPKVSWYREYLDYQEELKRRIESDAVTKKLTYGFYDFFEYEEVPGSKLYCYCQSFEWINGRNLAEYLNDHSMNWHQRMVFAKLILMGMKALHGVDVVHSDLKPENIYLMKDSEIKAGYQLKIIDFDTSLLCGRCAPWDCNSDDREGYFGTPGYLSPEHLKGEIPQKASDVFTCGIILCELLCSCGNPFSVDEEKYREQALNYDIPKPVLLDSTGDENWDHEIEDVIYSTLSPDPDSRPDIESLHRAMLRPTAPIGPRPIPRGYTVCLTGPNGATAEFNIDSIVGRSVLEKFGDEARFASSVQFRLAGENGQWMICPSSEARNATILNKELLSEPTALKFDDEVCIGNIKTGNFKLIMKVSGKRS